MDRRAAHALFQVVDRRNQTGGSGLTTNRSFAPWGQIFEDEVVAAAILNRRRRQASQPKPRRGQGSPGRFEGLLTTPSSPRVGDRRRQLRLAYVPAVWLWNS